MINWPSLKRFIGSSTGRLSLRYLAIMMFMSIAFSVVLFSVSSNQLGRHVPPSSYLQNLGSGDQAQLGSGDMPLPNTINRFLHRRIDEGRSELLLDIVLINIVVLIGGAGISYYLARQTLKPIEAALVSKDRFISDASHELRTPLTALQTTNEVALRKKKLSAVEVKNLLSENVNETKRLQALTDGLLGLLKEENGIGKTTSVSLQEMVSDSMSKVVAVAQANTITVEDKTSNWKLTTNPHALTQIITILLDNAIKYSEPGSAVTISSSKNAKHFRLAITDHGVGIKASDLPHIFERFYRADSSRTKQSTDGYGLGLAIAKKLATSLGGEIVVKSTLGKGSTFTLVLLAKAIESA
jgi:two-component system sensor histidine kinase CiaH